MKTVVVHCKLEPFDIFIGRPSIWGNPFKIGEPHPVTGYPMKRCHVIEEYKKYVKGSVYLMSKIEELRGKRLGCFCRPKKCHGDILINILEEKDAETVWNCIWED